MIVRWLPPVFFILSFVVVLLNDGGVYPVPLALAVVLMALAVASASLLTGVRRDSGSLFAAAMFLWLALCGWTVLQSLPVPVMLGNSAWASLNREGIDAPTYISVAPGDTLYALLPLSLPFLTFLGALLIFRRDSQVELALKVFGTVGASFALFAILQSTFSPRTLMFAAKQSYVGSLTAPFVNRNTAATFYGVVLLSLIVCAALSLRDQHGRRIPLSMTMPWRIWMFPGMAVITVLALALTQSRGGIVASVLACAFLLMALAKHVAGQNRSGLMPRKGQGAMFARRIAVTFGLLAGIALVSYLLFGRTILRGEIQGTEDGRFCVLPGIWQAIADNSLVGIGPGTFRFYFPAYRDSGCGLVNIWYRAHNVYLETILSFGMVVALASFGVSIVLILAVYRRGLQNRRRMKPVIYGAVASLLLVAVHSAVDFSLQIPGFAMVFAVFLALAGNISLVSNKRASSSAGK